MQKTLWVVGAGHESVYGIKRAKDMGLFVCASDIDPAAPGFEYADATVVENTYNALATAARAARFHERQRINGVLSFASDVPVTVAETARILGVPGVPVDVAKVAADKWLQKQALWKAGIPTPWGFLVDSPITLARTLDQFTGRKWVIKPADSRGARGVVRLMPKMDLEFALASAREFSLSGRVICEEWLDGPQISTETVRWKEFTATPGFLDRNYDRLLEFSPYVIEDGATQPSLLTPAKRTKTIALAEEAAKALGYFPIAKGDLVYTDRGPMVIEMACRLSGGLMSSVQVPEATGVQLLDIAIRAALGDVDREWLKRATTRTKHKAVAMRFFFPPPGRVTVAAHGGARLDDVVVGRVPEPGQLIESPTDHTKRAGYVITTGSSREGAIRAAERFIKSCEVRTCPT